MTNAYRVIKVPDNVADRTEPMGTKPKFWYQDTSLGRCLFKESRVGTGEDWAEKAAAELAELLGVPHASYELATWHGLRGTVSPSFKPEGGDLVHGNELLSEVVPGYPRASSGSRNFYRISQHTLQHVMRMVTFPNLKAPLGWCEWDPLTTSGAAFTGYLLLDAWIANQDRHHENWGWVIYPAKSPDACATIHLAPTYDHASSLGRNESDEERQHRLVTKDQGYRMQAYIEKARSAFYASEGDKRPLTTFDAFARIARRDPTCANAWLERLGDVSHSVVRDVFDRIPDDRISSIAIEFALKILELNKDRMLKLRKEFT